MGGIVFCNSVYRVWYNRCCLCQCCLVPHRKDFAMVRFALIVAFVLSLVSFTMPESADAGLRPRTWGNRGGLRKVLPRNWNRQPLRKALPRNWGNRCRNCSIESNCGNELCDCTDCTGENCNCAPARAHAPASDAPAQENIIGGFHPPGFPKSPAATGIADVPDATTLPPAQ